MFKFIFYIILTLVISNFFKLINSDSSSSNSKQLSHSNYGANHSRSNALKAMKKRSANFFEDNDENKNNNVDYIDLTNAYKDEITNEDKLKSEIKNKKRTLNRKKLNKKKRRKKKRKHNPSRFKRKDDFSYSKAKKAKGKYKVKLKSTLANDRKYQINKKPKMLSLQCEDRFQRLFKHVMKDDKNKQGNLNNLDCLNDHISRPVINRDKDIGDKDENVLNKIIDSFTSKNDQVRPFFLKTNEHTNKIVIFCNNEFRF